MRERYVNFEKKHPRRDVRFQRIFNKNVKKIQDKSSNLLCQK